MCNCQYDTIIFMDIKKAAQVLHDTFGFDSFREGQAEVIESVLAGKDTLVAMRTGGGKSLCYQVPALCCSGMAIVVSPLIALMKDQVDELRRKGIRAGALNSSLSPMENEQTLAEATKGELKILYVAPERFDSTAFISAICQIDVSFVAIDEAHCISVWGHDFRLAYKRLPNALDKLDQARGRRLARVPLTATATPSVREDISTQLQLQQPNTFMLGYSRENLSLNVIKVGVDEDKDTLLIQQMEQIPEHEPTIIYSATIKSIGIIKSLLARTGRSVTTYHGRLSPKDRQNNQDDFIGGKVNTIIATNAFGMGIDKSDIRHVIHYGMPASLENYYQEVGRGGRDGEPATGILLYEPWKDRNLQTFFIDTNHPDPLSVHGLYNKVRRLGLGRHEIDERNLIRGVDKAKDYQCEALLRRLEHVGLIDYQRLPEGRSWQINVKQTEATLDLQTLKIQRHNAMGNLKSMEQYCKSKDCRKYAVLIHFGEIKPQRHCGNCDQCAKQGIKPKPVSSSSSKDSPLPKVNKAQKESVSPAKSSSKENDRKIARAHVIELVHSVNFHISANHVSGTLIGADDEFLVQDQMDQLPQFGVMKEQGVIAALNAISDCVQSGLLVSKSVQGQFRLALTRKGWSAAKALKQARDAKQSQKVARHGASSLLEALVAMRLKIAKSSSTNPIVIANDATLEKMARYQPTSKTTLSKSGMTHQQIERFGERFLRCVADYKHDRSNHPTP